MKKNKFTIVLLTMLLCVCMTTVLVACQNQQKEVDVLYSAKYFKQTSTTKIIGSAKRQTVEVKDGGLSSYPSFNHTIKDADLKEKINEENIEFFNYDKMDSDGNLYIAIKDNKGKITGYEPKNQKLFKHSAADGIYEESVPQSADATVAKVHVKPSEYGNNLTGLYIPAGEVIKIIIDDNLVNKGGLVVNIGYGQQRGGEVNIPLGRDFTRFPIVRKTMTLAENINYIGSPLGGSLYFMSEYLMNNDKKTEYEVTVVGAIESPQYYFGSTSDAEWEKSKTAPGLFFHMEMRSGIRLTMPAIFARDKSAEEMRQLGQFYENTATISNKLSKGDWFSSHPVDCMFDSYVAAGAAVAFVGADFCMNPTSWAANALDYYGMTNNGAWGVLHEFNHHHQGWGAGAGGEVTNNVANFLTYALNTNIGAHRKYGSNLDGWNWVADAYQSLGKTYEYYESKKVNRELSLYVDLGHAFGEEFMYKLAANTPVKRITVNVDGVNKVVEDDDYNMNQFYTQASIISGYDMTYYLQTINNFKLSEESIQNVKAMNLPIYAPIASPYQTAIAMNGVDFVQMGKPYYVVSEITETIDFSKFVDMPNVIVKNIKIDITKAIGTFQKVDNYNYNYTPNATAKEHDEVIVEVERQFEDGTPIPNVKIKINLAVDNSCAVGKLYENSGFASIDDAIDSNFTGLNKIQDIANNSAVISTNIGNAIAFIEGKIVLPKGVYTLAVKGDDQSKLVVSNGDKEYKAETKLAGNYDYTNKNSLINLESNGTAMTFKLYMLNTGGKGSANIGFVSSYNLEGLPIIVDMPSKFLRNKNYVDNGALKTDFTQSSSNIGDYSVSARQEHMGSNPMVAVCPDRYGEDLPEYAVDGNKKTFYQSKSVEFPSEMVIDYGRKVEFNNINILPRRDSNSGGRIKEYEIWAGNLPAELSLISKGEGLNSFDGFDANTPITSARYIKIVVKSVFSTSYFAVGEVTPSVALHSNAIALSNNEMFSFNGDWIRNSYGSSLNGEVVYSSKGSVTIKFKGTGFAIMGNKDYALGSADIYIDDKKYNVMDCYANKPEYDKLLFIAMGLSDKWHNVEIKIKDNNAINFNYFLFEVSDNQAFLNGNLVAKGALPTDMKLLIFIVAISVAAIIIIAATIIALKVAISSNKKKKAIGKILDDVVLIEKENSLVATDIKSEFAPMKPIIAKDTQPTMLNNNTVSDAPMKPIKSTQNSNGKPVKKDIKIAAKKSENSATVTKDKAAAGGAEKKQTILNTSVKSAKIEKEKTAVKPNNKAVAESNKQTKTSDAALLQKGIADNVAKTKKVAEQPKNLSETKAKAESQTAKKPVNETAKVGATPKKVIDNMIEDTNQSNKPSRAATTKKTESVKNSSAKKDSVVTNMPKPILRTAQKKEIKADIAPSPTAIKKTKSPSAIKSAKTNNNDKGGSV